jgi:hypothetical protein
MTFCQTCAHKANQSPKLFWELLFADNYCFLLTFVCSTTLFCRSRTISTTTNQALQAKLQVRVGQKPTFKRTMKKQLLRSKKAQTGKRNAGKNQTTIQLTKLKQHLPKYKVLLAKLTAPPAVKLSNLRMTTPSAASINLAAKKNYRYNSARYIRELRKSRCKKWKKR